MKELKPFFTYEQQIARLQEKSLIISTEDALPVLSRINQYRLINAYGLELYDKSLKKYREGTSFAQIYDLYLFDEELRHVVSELVENFEILFRSKVSYCIAEHFGASGYLNIDAFEFEKYHRLFLETLAREKESQKKSPIVTHHNLKYGGVMPVWAIVEILSFGTVSKLYRNLKPELRREIAKGLGTDFNHLKSWLMSFVEVRNICAHYGRLYNKHLNFPPKFYRDYPSLDTTRIFSIVYLLRRYILNPAKWISMSLRIQSSLTHHQYVDLEKIGFPENWTKFFQ